LTIDFSGDAARGKAKTVLKDPQGRVVTIETGAPFTVNSVLSLTVAPHREIGATYRDGVLASREPALARFVEAFNAGRIRDAEAALAPYRADALTRAYLEMALAGHPDVDRAAEARWIGSARGILEAELRRRPGDSKAADLLDEVRLFQRAVQLFSDRRTG